MTASEKVCGKTAPHTGRTERYLKEISRPVRILGGSGMLQFNTIEEALDDFHQGKIILVTDDENRENEGDLICASEFATTENVNFMARTAKA